jgi:hypothetical protein
VKSSTYLFSRLACLAAIGFAVLGLSCSSSGLQSVSGTVLHKGQPIKGAVVTLHPKGAESDVKAQHPSGVSDENGKFTLSSGRESGAVPGDYIVTVVWLQEPANQGGKKAISTEGIPEAKDAFKGRYSDVKSSKLTVTIKPGMREIEPINLD